MSLGVGGKCGALFSSLINVGKGETQTQKCRQVAVLGKERERTNVSERQEMG